jgi:hypothetical protein
MITTNIRAIRYAGNASTSTAYPIVFPFLKKPEHIRVRVTPTGGTATDLDASAYTVHDPEGAAPYVTTATAYPSTTEVIVFRWVPFVQPLDLPEGGRFPAESMEDALDRLTMLTMQIGDMAVVDEEPGITVPATGLQDVPTWADAAARGAVKPARTGQLGYQRDNRGLFFSRSTNVGDWQLWTGPTTSQRLVLGLTSDTGTGDGYAEAVASLFSGWGVDFAVFAGDNRYAPVSFADAWAPFDAFVANQKATPALGNHDSADWAAHQTKFSYLGSNTRYYRRSLGNGLLDVFVLNSGRSTGWTVIEPDGNAVGSVQHQAFVSWLATSTAKWRIVVMHHPPVTCSGESNRADTNLDWPEFAQVDAIVCGHAHLSEWAVCRGVPVVNVSGGVQVDGFAAGTLALAGVAPLQSDLLWVEESRRLAARMEVTAAAIRISYHDVSSGALVYSRTVSDTTQARGAWGDALGEPTDSFTSGDSFLLGKCPVNLRNPTAYVQGFFQAPGTATIDINLDDVTVGTATLTAAESGAVGVAVDLSRGIARGTQAELSIGSVSAYADFRGPLSINFTGNLAS